MNHNTKIFAQVRGLAMNGLSNRNRIRPRVVTALGCISLCCVLSSAVDGQEPDAARSAPAAALERTVTKPILVELHPGMTRNQVSHLLGPPDFESIIGVLRRARLSYGDTELLFENDKLIALKTAQETQSAQDGRMAVKHDGTTIVYGEELLLVDATPLPVGDQRQIIDDQFYFKQVEHQSTPIEIHFTPSTPQCLLDDCPGCEVCQACHCGLCPAGATRCVDGGCEFTDCDGLGGFNGRASDPWNLFRVSVDALFLWRDGADFSAALLDGGNVLQTTPLSHGLTPGLRATADLKLTATTAAQFVYIGMHQWSATGADDNLIPPATGVLSSRQTYDATLDDFQLNFVYSRLSSDQSLFWGVRVSEHEDEFSVRLDGQIAGPPAVVRNPLSVSANAQNRLIGLQIGANQFWRCGRLQLFGQIKGGVLHNEIDQTGPASIGAVDLTSNPASIPSFVTETEEVSFLGDFEFSARYRFLPSASIRVGYQGLIFTNLAQVAGNLGQPTDPDSLSYHGVLAGLEIIR